MSYLLVSNLIAIDSYLGLLCRSRNCEDIDECAKNNGKGDCEHACANTAGSFRCSCPAGFSLGVDGLTCNDIDECQADNGECSQKCVNQPGNYSCACFDGFVNTGQNGTDVICIDIGKFCGTSRVFTKLELRGTMSALHVRCVLVFKFTRLPADRTIHNQTLFSFG